MKDSERLNHAAGVAAQLMQAAHLCAGGSIASYPLVAGLTVAAAIVYAADCIANSHAAPCVPPTSGPEE